MDDFYDALLFGDDRSPNDHSLIEERFEDDPDLASAWAHWCEVRRRIRDRLQEHLPDRRLLVLYVLEREGDADALTAQEREALDEVRDDIARAIDVIPALEQVVARIRDERADFDEMWATHVGGEDVRSTDDGATTDGRTQRDPTEREDRAARPPKSRDEAWTRRWTRRLAVAVVVAGLAVTAVLFWPEGPSATTVTVADGSVQVETLADGSTIRLVGPATLSYSPGDAQSPTRRVTLADGRAFFDVQPRKETSFVVETPTARATVLGTQFGVTTQPDTTEVVLASGAVRVEDAKRTDGVVLEPGQQSRVVKNETPTTPTQVDLSGALDWTGLFVFRSLPLDAIAERLNRHYEARITVAESLTDEVVTGTFDREQPASEVVRALAATLGADVQTNGENRYRVVPSR